MKDVFPGIIALLNVFSTRDLIPILMRPISEHSESPGVLKIEHTFTQVRKYTIKDFTKCNVTKCPKVRKTSWDVPHGEQTVGVQEPLTSISVCIEYYDLTLFMEASITSDSHAWFYIRPTHLLFIVGVSWRESSTLRLAMAVLLCTGSIR